VTTLDTLRRDKKAEILRLAEAYGCHNVRVFGSVATRESRPDSDVDFLVDLVESGCSMLTITPFTLYRSGECGSSMARMRATWPVRFRHQTWAQSGKMRCWGVTSGRYRTQIRIRRQIRNHRAL
jgi:hypothetical protein